MPTVTKTLQQVAVQVTSTTTEVVGTALTLVNGFVGSNPVAKTVSKTVSKTVIDLTDRATEAVTGVVGTITETGEGLVRTLVGRPARPARTSTPAARASTPAARPAAKPTAKPAAKRAATKPVAKRVPVKRTPAKATTK